MKKRVLSLTLVVMALAMAIPTYAANPVKIYEHNGTGRVIAELSDVTGTTEAEGTYDEPIKVYHLPANATVTFHIPSGSDWWSLFRCNGMWVEQYNSGLKNNVAYTCDALNADIAAGETYMGGAASSEPTNEFLCEIMPLWEMTEGERLFKLVFDGAATEKPTEPTKPTGTKSDFVISPDDILLLYKGSGGDVVIPDGVTTIGQGQNVFSGGGALTSVTIPNSVTSIGQSAFAGCAGLTSVTIPDSVTSIGRRAFQSCTGLTSVTIGEGVTGIGDWAFSGCEGLTSVTIPSGVTSIADSAFYQCKGLTSVVLLAGVTSIGEDAFRECESLTSVTIPSSVASIADRAFYECASLKDVYYGGTEAQWNAIYIRNLNDKLKSANIHYNSPMPKPTAGSGSSSEIQNDFEINGGVLKRYKGSGGAVSIPAGVTSIGDSVFNGCVGLTGVTIPSGVTGIGDWAFSGCVNLANVTIPSGVTSIGNVAFKDCTSLTDIAIPNSVTDIGDGAFENCKSLTSVTIPAGVTGTGSYAFRSCAGLTSVTIAEGVTRIEDSVFFYCKALTSVAIPSSVTAIEDQAFSGCDGLKDIYYGGTESQWKAINISNSYNSNAALISATIHYNSSMPEPTKSEEPATYTANPTNDPLKVDGASQVPTAYKIGDSNYFQLRDVAMMLNGTPAQFSVDYDAGRQAVVIVTGEPYKPLGTELAGAAADSTEAILGNNDIYINGEKADFAVYKINGANFFQIRALGQALGFNVGWSAQQGMFIESDKPYDPAN